MDAEYIGQVIAKILEESIDQLCFLLMGYGLVLRDGVLEQGAGVAMSEWRWPQNGLGMITNHFQAAIRVFSMQAKDL